MGRLIVDVALQHPEYQGLLEDPDSVDRDFLPETGDSNPFLHLAMHIAIEEQLSTGRPPGIRKIYKELLIRLPDKHTVRHQMMECLSRLIWQAQRDQLPPDEGAYLDCLKASGTTTGRR